MMYGTIEFDLDIDIHPSDAAILSYDPDPLSHPRYDLFQSSRMGGLGPLIGVTLPVSTPCVDVLDCYMNAERDCVTLEHMGLPDYGDRQICLRLFRQKDGAHWETSTHSWCSSEPAFEEVTEIIKSSVAAGESPLWNLARGMSLPAEFVDALSMGIGGDLVCPQLIKDDVEKSIWLGFCSTDEYLKTMGCMASPWEQEVQQ